MNCKNCKRKVEKNQRHCTICGHTIQQKASSGRAIKITVITVGMLSIGVLTIALGILFMSKDVENQGNVSKVSSKEIQKAPKEMIPKEDDIKTIKEEWLYYSIKDGLYRAQRDGQVVIKLLSLEINSTWEFIEDTGEGYIYYAYANILYRADPDGSNEIQLSEESLSTWEVIKDEIIGTTWLLCRGERSFLLSLDGKTEVPLSRPDIENVILYNNQIIYDLKSDPYTEVVQNHTIYSCDFEGKETVFIEKDKVEAYSYLEEEQDLDYGYIYLLGKDKKDIYFGIVNDIFMSVHVFKKDMVTGEIKEVYIVSTPMHPYIGFELDEKYIYLSYSEMRHDYTTVQIGMDDYEVKGYGSIIGKDKDFIYKSRYEGIYKFDIKTEEETLIRNIYPMYWYTDYKSHNFRKIDDWIYFDDYDEEPVYEDYNNPVDIPTYLYRINVKTGQEEGLDESYEEIFHDYHFTYQKRQDEEGYNYFYKQNAEKSYDIIKAKDEIKEIVVVDIKSPIQKLEVINISIEQSIKILLETQTIVVEKGKTVQLNYKVHPIDAKVYFKSDNPSRAAVSDIGVISAYGKGEVTITVIAIKDGYKRDIQIVDLTISENEEAEDSGQKKLNY